MTTSIVPNTKNKEIERKKMAGKEDGRKLTFNLKNVRDFFGGLFQSSKNTTLAKNVSSADEACDESFNGGSVVQKEVLIDWSTAGDKFRSKRNDDSNASRKDLQDEYSKSLSELVEREVDTRKNSTKTFKFDEGPQSAMNLIQTVQKCDSKREIDNIIGTVKTDEKPQLSRSSIQNRNNQNVSKGVERPKPCKFKTEDGLWLCEVCAWSCSDSTSLSFLNHCSTTEHREKMRGRFGTEQEPWGPQGLTHNSSEVKNETRESKANLEFLVWSEKKENGEVSGVKIIQKKPNVEPQKKTNICNPEKPRTEMMFKSQQAQNQVCQKSSRQEGLTTRLTTGSLKKGSPPVEELLEMLAVSHSLSGGMGQNDIRGNETKLEVSSFKEKLYEIVKKGEVNGISESGKNRKKKKKKIKPVAKKVENNSKINTTGTNDVYQGGKGGGQDSTMSKTEVSRMADLRKWISELGIFFIEPMGENNVKCKVCQKYVPAGSNFETMVCNVGIHLQGRGHVKKLSQIEETSRVVVSLMKSIQQCPTVHLPSLI